jgi:hypothetical protein
LLLVVMGSDRFLSLRAANTLGRTLFAIALFVFVSQLAQLVDVDPLIMQTISGGEGRPHEAIAIEALASRDLLMSNGYRQKDAPDGSRVYLGRDVKTGFMSRYRIDDVGKWTIEEQMRVDW